MPHLVLGNPRILGSKGSPRLLPHPSDKSLSFARGDSRVEFGTEGLPCHWSTWELGQHGGGRGLEDPHGHSSRLSLADRMKASAVASPRVSGHQDSPGWKGLESNGDPGRFQS